MTDHEALAKALKIMKAVIAYKTLLTREEAKAVIAALEAAIKSGKEPK